MTIRHSALPKLAVCGQYQSAPGESEAAARGNRLDNAFRLAISEINSRIKHFLNLPDDDSDAVWWAVNQVRQLSDNTVTADAQKCRVRTPGMDHVGTVDAVCVAKSVSFDLKSGQIYDYEAQMAAYSLGLMTMHGVDTWTTHLLFCDQRIVTTTHWTYERAREVMHAALDNIGTAPRENQYCGWCVKSLTCGARVKSMSEALVPAQAQITPDNDGFLTLLNDPQRLGRFLSACNTLDDFRDAAKAKARGLLEAGVDVPGWTLGKQRETKTVDAHHLIQGMIDGEIDAEEIIEAHGPLSAAKARQIWGPNWDSSIVTTKTSQAPLMATK